MAWIELGGAGGDLTGILRNDYPTLCLIKGNFAAPPVPKNPDGSPAKCFTEPPALFNNFTLRNSAFNDIVIPGGTPVEGPVRASVLAPPFSQVLHAGTNLSNVNLTAFAAVNASNGNPVAEMNAAAFYYDELGCSCAPGQTISLQFTHGDLGFSNNSTGFLNVRTTSGRFSQSDLFQLSGNSSSTFVTTPLTVETPGRVAVLIELGVIAQVNLATGATASAFAEISPPASFVVPTNVESFDPVGSTATTTRAIADPTATGPGAFNSQLVSGWYAVAGGATEGFQRLAGGTIKAPLIDPNDTLHYTAPFGMNNAGTIVGTFENTTGVGGGAGNTFHGFFLSPAGTFTNFDVGIPGVSTGIQAINNLGDITGDYGSVSLLSQGFLLPHGGTTVTFSVPGMATFPQAMNDSDTIVGIYLDAGGNSHGFMRTVDGLLQRFDFPGAVSTHAEGINNAGTIDGYFVDTAGHTHGFFGPFGLFQQYDLPGATSTFPRGINNAGAVAGSYTDSRGLMHGFAAQLCASNVTPAVAVTQGPITLNSATGEYVQTLTLKNTGSTLLTAPIYVALNNLPPGVFPANALGFSTCAANSAPYLLVPALFLPAGAATTVQASFLNVSGGPISYTPIVLSGLQTP
jgi:hypothetical protein